MDIEFKNDVNPETKNEPNIFSESTIDLETFEEWSELPIPEELLRGIYAYGFEKPSPIQRKSILSVINGRDILAQASSGTGKTGSFVISALSKINTSLNELQVLIVSPTRELTKQIYGVIEGLSVMMPNLKKYFIIGGTSIEDDAKYFNNNTPHILVACPGRLYDFVLRKYVKLNTVKLIIMDETDEMVSFGFKDQMYNIFKEFNTKIQVALFSATYSPYNNKILETILKNPVKIIVKAEALTLEGISQFYIAIENDKQKYLVIKDLFSSISVSQTIIFCNSVERVIELHKALKEDDFPVCCVHSNLEKRDRDEAFSEFKSGKYRVMVSSNITARGIDLQQISVVINFDLPKCKHTFLHRIGRTSRFGRKGMAINLITKRDVPKLKEFEEYYSTEIKELPQGFEKIIN